MKRLLSLLFLLAAGILFCSHIACNAKLPGAPANAIGGPTPVPCSNCGPVGSTSLNGNFQLINNWSGPSTSQLSYPWSSVDINGNIWTTDDSNAYIQVENANGQFIKNITSGGLSCPEGITRQGNLVYVADNCNNNIAIFDLSGNYLGQIYFPGGINLGSPDDVAVDRQGYVYTTAAGPCDVYKISPDHKTVQVIANTCTGQTVGGVQNPTGIALDQYGDILLADQINGGTSRVVIYDNAGHWLNEYRGFGNVSFNQVVGIRVDGANHIFLADSSNRVIYEGDLAGNLIAQIGAGTLDIPRGLDVNLVGRTVQVYVSDSSNARVYYYTGTN